MPLYSPQDTQIHHSFPCFVFQIYSPRTQRIHPITLFTLLSHILAVPFQGRRSG